MQHRLFIIMLCSNALLLITDIFAWIFDGIPKYTEFLYADVLVGYGIGYIMFCQFSHYVVACIPDKKDFPAMQLFLYMVNVCCVLAMLLLIVSSYNNMFFSYVNGVFVRGKHYWMSQIIPFLMLLANQIVVLINRRIFGKRYTVALLSYCFFPMLSMIVQLFLSELEITYTVPTMSLLLIYVMINTEQSIILKKKETEFEKNRASLMLSQMQPLFLYDTLGVIADMCKKRPKDAKKTIGLFSQYLRYNIDSLSSKTMIPFETELEHIEKYIYLEKLSLGEKLLVEYEIEESDFLVPALSIGPLVENAVKHGVYPKGGGTVSIKSYADGNDNTIIVTDDGVGFEESEISIFDSKGSLLGVRSKIVLQCGGRLDVESKVGEGTRVTVVFPKEWENLNDYK